MSARSSVHEKTDVEQLFCHLQPRLALVCSDNVLRDIAYHAQFSESELGTRLNISSSDVANIDPRENGYEKKYQVFSIWKRRFGDGATYSAFIKALARCRPFDMQLLERVKFAIEEDMSSAVEEADSQLSTKFFLSSLPCQMTSAGGNVLIASITSQLCLNRLLLSKEKECQSLQVEKKYNEEKIHQLQLLNTTLQEKLEKQDSQWRERIHQLQVENKYLRDGLELPCQTQSPSSVGSSTSLHTPIGIPSQVLTHLPSENMADLIVPKSEEDSVASSDINHCTDVGDCESTSEKKVFTVNLGETEDLFSLSLSEEESLSRPHVEQEESLYLSDTDQQCNSISLATSHGGQELGSNKQHLTFGEAFLTVDESAMMEWPSRQSRKRSLSPDTSSPVHVKILLT